MESCTYTIKEAHADLNALDFGKDPLELKNYIKKRLDKNDVKQIMELQDISPALYAKLQKCQPTSASVERSFSLLKSFLRPNRNFKDSNIPHYMKLLGKRSRSGGEKDHGEILMAYQITKNSQRPSAVRNMLVEELNHGCRTRKGRWIIRDAARVEVGRRWPELAKKLPRPQTESILSQKSSSDDDVDTIISPTKLPKRLIK
ncbi:unnamed protein product [Clavelina lepadiformis]|uniref:Uncharacterized protein n=1 Tax=Clavelina lepadiformis TaxID=159417 RepID=A0ABP0F3D1_CLALP